MRAIPDALRLLVADRRQSVRGEIAEPDADRLEEQEEEVVLAVVVLDDKSTVMGHLMPEIGDSWTAWGSSQCHNCIVF